MKPAAFAFARPSSLQEALEALQANKEAKVLAGGQSLIPLLSMRLAAPEMLVDINGIAELSYIHASPEGVRVGALGRHAAVESSAEAARVQPLLGEALRMVAHPTIRNRGTVVGSIVHGDAAAEMPAVLALLGGSVTATSVTGNRNIPVADLFVGPMESSLRADEIATEVFFPALPPNTGVACDEIARRNGDYALCGVAATVSLDDAGKVTSARAGYLSVCEMPTVLELSEVFAAGALERDTLDEAAELAIGSLSPEDDIHASAAYRGQLARVLTKRVLRAAYEDATNRSKGVMA